MSFPLSYHATQSSRVAQGKQTRDLGYKLQAAGMSLISFRRGGGGGGGGVGGEGVYFVD